jgi:hypothetical protein
VRNAVGSRSNSHQGMKYPTTRQQMSPLFVRDLESTYSGANVALSLPECLSLWAESNSRLLAKHHFNSRFIVDFTSSSHSNIIRRRFLEEGDLVGWLLHPHGFWESATPMVNSRVIRRLRACAFSAGSLQPTLNKNLICLASDSTSSHLSCSIAKNTAMSFIVSRLMLNASTKRISSALGYNRLIRLPRIFAITRREMRPFFSELPLLQLKTMTKLLML